MLFRSVSGAHLTAGSYIYIYICLRCQDVANMKSFFFSNLNIKIMNEILILYYLRWIKSALEHCVIENS